MTRALKMAWLGAATLGMMACSPSQPSGSSEGTGQSPDEAAGAEGAEGPAAIQSLFKDLGKNGRRMKLIVLPGDASVEIDGAPARRRDGIIELAGKIGESHRLRVFKGAQYLEEDVKIPDSSPAPLTLDLDAPVAAGSGAKKSAKGSKRVPKEGDALPLPPPPRLLPGLPGPPPRGPDPLLPDNFE